MPYSEPPPAVSRRARWTLVTALVAVGAAVIGVVEYETSTTAPPTTSSSRRASPPALSSPTLSSPTPSSTATEPTAGTPFVRRAHSSLAGVPGDLAGKDDGVVPDGVTVFDDGYPAVTNLNPALLGALRQAASVAANSGVTFYVNSGWRSPKYQEQLLQEAIAKYGSAKAAARWVATPDTSAHVSGNAVDIGDSNADKWLSLHGAAYGLCQIYRNEAWHYELRPDAISHGCPAMYADPTQDPRMQQ